MRVRRLTSVLLGMPSSAVLLLGALGPAVILLVYSFYGYALFRITPGFHVEWYRQIIDDHLYRVVARSTLAIAVPTTLISTVGGYAIAHYIVFIARRRNVLLALVVVSLLASFLARVYAWRTLMGVHGIVNTVLASVGLIDHPLGSLLFSRLPVILAEVNLYMPIAALICFASLAGVPGELAEVARSLGAGRAMTLRRITLPLAGRALLGSLALTFFLSCGDYVTPAFLGGPTSGETVGTVIAAQISTAGNYPLGAALSFTMITAFALYGGLVYLALRAARLLPRDVA